jgi:hypothetical protein
VSLHTRLLERKVFQIIPIMKLEEQDMTAGSLSSATAQRMDLNTVGIFFNVLEKATKNNLFDTS